MDVEEFRSCDAEWLFGCSIKMRHFPILMRFGLFYRKKCLIDEVGACFCIRESCGSRYGCSLNAIAEVKIVRRLERYGIV